MPKPQPQPVQRGQADNVVLIRPELAPFKEVIMADSTAKPAGRSSIPAAAPGAPKPKVWPAPLGRPPSIENRHPNELEIDFSYQRSTDAQSSQTLIRKIAQNWDWRMCLPLVVSNRRDEGLFVIDGQHRLAAAKLRGDIDYLPCCVSTYDSVAAEATMFVAMNRVRKAISKADDFHAAIASGDPTSLAIQKLIIDAGLSVARTTGRQSWAPGAVSFTTAIKAEMNKHGPKVCADALRMMAEAFPDEVLQAGSPTFQALVKIFIDKAKPAPDRDRLFRALLSDTQAGWASYVLGVPGGTTDRALALKQAFLMAYDDAGKVSQV